MLAFDTNFIKFKTNFSTPKFVVYVDSFHDRWRAFLNGKKTRLYRADIAFKGLWVPSGENVVDLRFGQSWQYVFKYFLLGIFYMVAFVLFFFWIKDFSLNKSKNTNIKSYA